MLATRIDDPQDAKTSTYQLQLPIPQEVNGNSNSVTWGEDRMNALELGYFRFKFCTKNNGNRSPERGYIMLGQAGIRGVKRKVSLRILVLNSETRMLSLRGLLFRDMSPLRFGISRSFV